MNSLMAVFAVMLFFTALSSLVGGSYTMISCSGPWSVIDIIVDSNISSNSESPVDEHLGGRQCTVHNDSQPDSANQVVIHCQSLQEALELIVELNSRSCSSAGAVLYQVRLSPHQTHMLTDPIMITTNASSLHITSNPVVDQPPQPALIQCNYNPQPYLSRGVILHSLYFNALSYATTAVMFSDIIMVNCPLPVRINGAGNVTLRQSQFKYFNEAVFDIHNSLLVSVSDCWFMNNAGTGIINEPYRGNTGGLSITYNYLPSRTPANPVVTVTNCTFINNIASLPNSEANPDLTFGIGVLPARGGGAAVFIREHVCNISVHISTCRFHGNRARSYGGGLYILLNGLGNHDAVVRDTHFESNTAMEGGGALIIVGAGQAIDIHSILIENSTFVENASPVGGAVYYSINFGGGTSNVIRFFNCSIIGNRLLEAKISFGAAMAVDISEDFEAKDRFPVNDMENCLFKDNVGENSIVSIGFQIFRFSGTNQFIGNKGTTLRIIGTGAILENQIDFINNTAADGVALLLLSLSQLSLSDGLQMVFQGNRGRFGSSIYVSAASSYGVFQEVAFNPLCFLLLRSDPQLPPSLWHTKGINITFTGNIALFGAAIYTAGLAQCSWISNNGEYFDLQYFPLWPIFTIRDDNRNDAFSDPFNQNYSIVTDSVDLQITKDSDHIHGWPGETLSFTVQAIDQLGHPTGGLMRLTYTTNDTTSDLSLVPNTALLSSESIVYTFTYYITYTGCRGNIDACLNGDMEFDISSVTSSSNEADVDTVPFHSVNCIGGYTLVREGSNGNRTLCRCEESDSRIILCEDDQDSVIIKDGLWACHYSNNTGSSLFLYLCPFQYCRCFLNSSEGSSSCVSVFTNSDPDRQCTCGRKGILCGECSEDSSSVTVLYNHCTNHCSDSSIALIPALVLVVAIVITVIVVIDKPLPQWVYPVLFYIQVVPLASSYFPLSFDKLGRYLSFAGSALSLFYPFDFCIHQHMTTLDSFGLKYIPTIAAVVLIPLILLIRCLLLKCYLKLPTTRPTRHTFNGYGIWTVLLLVFNQTIYTSYNILHCPSIPDNRGNHHLRWFHNGSVECFTDDHLPLAIFAIFWCLISVVLITAVAIIPYCNRDGIRISHKIFESLKYPFVDGHSYWFTLELSRRLILLTFITFLPSNSSIVLMVVMVLIVLYSYCTPYKAMLANIIEVINLTIFMLLLGLRINRFLQDSLQDNLKRSGSNITSIPSCDDNRDRHYHTEALTVLATILAVLYYTPVGIGITCFIVHIARSKYSKLLLFKAKVVFLRHTQHSPVTLSDEGDVAMLKDIETQLDYDQVVTRTANSSTVTKTGSSTNRLLTVRSSELSVPLL